MRVEAHIDWLAYPFIDVYDDIIAPVRHLTIYQPFLSYG